MDALPKFPVRARHERQIAVLRGRGTALTDEGTFALHTAGATYDTSVAIAKLKDVASDLTVGRRAPQNHGVLHFLQFVANSL